MPYSGHNGVKYRRYTNDENEDDSGYEEPEHDETNAVLEELYYESWSGTLEVSVGTGEGFLSLSVPIKADKDWNGFVESLPEWD